MSLESRALVRLKQVDEKERNRIYGPPPSNPFERLRLEFGFSLGELATQTKISKQALRRCEYGTYTNPLPSLMDWWIKWPKAQRLELSEGTLRNDYYDFQYSQRTRHRHLFGTDLLVNIFNPLHPFRQLRRKHPSLLSGEPLPLGLVECAKAMCVPMDTIQYFEKKFRLQQSVPSTILNALNEMGYSRPQLTEFENAYASYRKRYLIRV